MSRALKNGLLVAAGAVVLATTLGVYLLFDFSKTEASNLAMVFVLFSEFALFVGVVLSANLQAAPNNVFIRSGILGTLSFYFVATVVLLLISGIFGKSMNNLWAAEIIALSIILIIIIAVTLLSFKINNSDQRIMSDRRLMQICEKRIYDLLALYKNNPAELKLCGLLDRLKYCDKIGPSSTDDKIVGAILRLEKELVKETPDADDIINEINAFISIRNNETADNKRGGF